MLYFSILMLKQVLRRELINIMASVKIEREKRDVSYEGDRFIDHSHLCVCCCDCRALLTNFSRKPICLSWSAPPPGRNSSLRPSQSKLVSISNERAHGKIPVYVCKMKDWCSPSLWCYFFYSIPFGLAANGSVLNDDTKHQLDELCCFLIHSQWEHPCPLWKKKK